jgi:hypothetical protein
MPSTDGAAGGTVSVAIRALPRFAAASNTIVSNV